MIRSTPTNSGMCLRKRWNHCAMTGPRLTSAWAVTLLNCRSPSAVSITWSGLRRLDYPMMIVEGAGWLRM